MDLVHEQRIPIPRALMRVALTMMRRSVKKRAGFSLDLVNPLEVVPAAFIPALFGACTVFLRLWSVRKVPCNQARQMYCWSHSGQALETHQACQALKTHQACRACRTFTID